MKIYIASSWKMENVVKDLALLLRGEGHEVDCFCDDSNGRYVFHWSEIANKEELDAISFLADKRTQKAFREDKKWLDWAEICILVVPSGKSAHLEAGYIKGQGKRLLIYGEFPPGEFDVMYGFADGLYKWDELDALLKISK